MLAIPLAMAMLVLTAGLSAAQTLTDPNSRTAPAERSTPPKSPASVRAHACSAYGAGFIQLPGTDACVKIGGFVRMETGAGK